MGPIGMDADVSAYLAALEPKARRIRLDATTVLLHRGAISIALRTKTLAVLRYLAERTPAVIASEELRQAVWGAKQSNRNGPKQCIRELRIALDDPCEVVPHIETVGRLGYRFVGTLEIAQAPGSSGEARRPPSDGFPACIGRDTELEMLEDASARSRRSARSIIFVTGEAGSGKTTLVDAFATRISRSQEIWLARGQCFPQHGRHESFGPLLQLLADLSTGEVGPTLKRLLQDHAPACREQLPSIFSTGETERFPYDRGAIPERMARELTDVLERLTQQTPGILLIEDLQWSDPATLDWIAAWGLRRAPARLMILATARAPQAGDEHRHLNSTLGTLNRHGGFRQIELTGLDVSSVGAYLAARFPNNRFPFGLAQLLTDRTEGHPFFFTAAVDEWLSNDVVRNEDNAWVVRENITDPMHSVPANVSALIEHQILQLSDEARRLLESGSVAGLQFPAALFGHALEEIEGIERLCEDLARRGLFIRRASPMVWPDATASMGYAFRHALYQHALYEAIPTATKRALHQRIGERFERAYGDRAHEIAAVLADHFERASDAFRAASYRRQAGEAALKKGVMREAAGQFTKALALLNSHPADKASLREELLIQMGLGEAVRMAESYESIASANAFRRARALCDELEDTDTLAPALLGLWYYFTSISDFPGALEIVRELTALAENLREPHLVMASHNMASQTYWFVGDYREAERHIDPVIDFYDVEKHAKLSRRFRGDPGMACRMSGVILSQLRGLSETSERHFEAGMDIARSLGHPPFDTSKMLFAGAIAAKERGDLDLTRSRCLALMEICMTSSVRLWVPVGEALLGWLALQEDDRQGFERAKRGADPVSRWAFQPYRDALLLDAYISVERWSEGLALASKVLADTSSSGAVWYDAELHRLTGELMMRALRAFGAPQWDSPNNDISRRKALDHFDRATEIARSQGVRQLELRAASSRVGWADPTDRARCARELLAPVLGGWPAVDRNRDVMQGRAYMAELDRLSGPPGEAIGAKLQDPGENSLFKRRLRS